MNEFFIQKWYTGETKIEERERGERARLWALKVKDKANTTKGSETEHTDNIYGIERKLK